MTHVIVFLRPTGQTGQTLPEQRTHLESGHCCLYLLYVHDYWLEDNLLIFLFIFNCY